MRLSSLGLLVAVALPHAPALARGPEPIPAVKASAKQPPGPAAPRATEARERDEPVTDYLDVEVRWLAGKIEVAAAEPGRYPRPTKVPKWRGRFTLILARGKASVAEREFDFALLADAESSDFGTDAQKVGVAMRNGVTRSTARVRLPMVPGADALWVYDNVTRATFSATLASVLKPASQPAPGPAAPGSGAAR